MNPYDILGVAPDASDEEIAKAYKRLAKRYHPDLNPGDAAAAERMGRINQAYDQIKAMRQRGEACGGQSGGQYGPSYTYSYNYSYTPRRRSPIGMIIAVVVMFFLIRLVLSLLFGGYSRAYTVPGYYPGYYGYYQVIPR